VDNKVVDVNRIETGFRKTEFKGGAGTGGVVGEAAGALVSAAKDGTSGRLAAAPVMIADFLIKSRRER